MIKKKTSKRLGCDIRSISLPPNMWDELRKTCKQLGVSISFIAVQAFKRFLGGITESDYLFVADMLEAMAETNTENAHTLRRIAKGLRVNS